MYNINAKKCLIIPDVHQDLDWASEIIARESSEVDHIVFLGDYFDTKRSDVATAEETAHWLRVLKDDLGNRVTFLLGNHDVPYLAAVIKNGVAGSNPHRCSGYSDESAVVIDRVFNDGFWSNFYFIKVTNGHILTHAGLHSGFWNFQSPNTSNLEYLHLQLGYIKDDIKLHTVAPLLAAGRSRGGSAACGGITWQDWKDDFADSLPLPQVVGHSTYMGRPRKIGNSYCLDGNQTIYGILNDGKMIVKDTNGEIMPEPFYRT